MLGQAFYFEHVIAAYAAGVHAYFCFNGLKRCFHLNHPFSLERVMASMRLLAFNLLRIMEM